MAQGGARNRSGPGQDPKSLRSAKRLGQGVVVTALPREGRRGRTPAFPLPRLDLDDAPGPNEPGLFELRGRGPSPQTLAFRKRELAVWAEHWRMPQACVWESEPWRWPSLAEMCRLKVAIELNPRRSAALVAQLHRYRDQLGLTPAGMKQLGWAITGDETAEKRTRRQRQAETDSDSRLSARARVRVIDGGGGA